MRESVKVISEHKQSIEQVAQLLAVDPVIVREAITWNGIEADADDRLEELDAVIVSDTIRRSQLAATLAAIFQRNGSKPIPFV